MTDNVRKIFEIIGVEPNEKFKLEIDPVDILYYITEDLDFIATNKKGNIIKLSKEPKKKKLRDLTEEEFERYKKKCFGINCNECIFRNISCGSSNTSWIYHKELYSDKFLDQEIEVE